MPIVSRRTFSKGLLASALLPGHAAVARANDPAGIAIIDTPNNAARYAAQLAAQNVKVVVRFFARKPQPGLSQKVMAADANMIEGAREPAILIRHGLSLVSLYQYRNNLPEKFVKGLEDTGSPGAEAAADAQAALAQAKLVGQPEGSAIYFGVDFNVTPATVSPVLDYFRAMNRTVGNHYALGVYGNGFVNRILRAEKLVAYNWLSASRAHAEAVAFYNSGQWHLFQNQVDRRWFAPAGKCGLGLDVDTNLQNPAAPGIGAWGAGGVDGGRAARIFGERRFALRETPVVANGGARPGCASGKPVPRNANVRILAQSAAWCSVDIDEDGLADGQVKTADLTADLATMPPWGSSA